MAGDLNARSPWEHIGGTIVLGGIGMVFFADAWIGLGCMAIGAVCIGVGWRAYQRRGGDGGRGGPSEQ